jgi:rhomboid protease GluP
VEKPQQFKRYFRQGIVLTLLINIAYGFSINSIDNYGHIGGLIGGLLVAGVVKVEMKKYKISSRLPYMFVAVLLFVYLLIFGFSLY